MTQCLIYAVSIFSSSYRRSENPVDLDELLDINEGEKKWKKSYYQLKEDFEKLKLTRRTPSPFMSRLVTKWILFDIILELLSIIKELHFPISYSACLWNF